jgi:HSP20 family protein
MELPGLSRSDITLEFSEPILTVRGTRPPQDCNPERYQQLERGQGQFSRSFKFALPVEGESITAEFADGVLTVVVPKTSAGRRIDVS